MKKITLILVFIFIGFKSFAQPDMKNDTMLHENRGAVIHLSTNVDKPPVFANDQRKFTKFIAENFVAPETEGNNIDFIVSFIVETDGSISDVILTKRVETAVKNEINRVVMLTNRKWSSAENNGEKVRCQYNFPMNLHN